MFVLEEEIGGPTKQEMFSKLKKICIHIGTYIGSTTLNMSSSEKEKKRSFMMNIPLGYLLVGFLLLPVLYRMKSYSGDSFRQIVPGFFLFTPLRPMTLITREVFSNPLPTVEIPPVPIPSIEYETEYSYERLREVSRNFQRPVVVRGMFLNTTATNRWMEPGYVSSWIGQYHIDIVLNGFHNASQSRKTRMPFRDVYEEILRDPKSTKYMFFPIKSRVGKAVNVTEILLEEELHEKLNEMARTDLDYDRIWKGFGDPIRHETFKGSQLIAGNGQEGLTTGSYWHCAVGNNWFMQVVGGKRWWFIDQRYSSFMRPMRHGLVSFTVGNRKIDKELRYLPREYVDLEAGDMLYNPDFEWHTVENKQGLSVAVPAREVNVSLSLQNNFQFSMAVLLNVFFSEFGIAYGLVG